MQDRSLLRWTMVTIFVGVLASVVHCEKAPNINNTDRLITVSQIINIPAKSLLPAYSNEIAEAFKSIDEQFYDGMAREERSASRGMIKDSSALRSLVDAVVNINSTQNEEPIQLESNLLTRSVQHLSPNQLKQIASSLATRGHINRTSIDEYRQISASQKPVAYTLKSVGYIDPNNRSSVKDQQSGTLKEASDDQITHSSLLMPKRGSEMSALEFKDNILSRGKKGNLHMPSMHSQTRRPSTDVSSKIAFSNISNSDAFDSLTPGSIESRIKDTQNSKLPIQPLLSLLSYYKNHLNPSQQEALRHLQSNFSDAKTSSDTLLVKRSYPMTSDIDEHLQYLSEGGTEDYKQFSYANSVSDVDISNESSQKLLNVNIDSPQSRTELNHFLIDTEQQNPSQISQYHEPSRHVSLAKKPRQIEENPIFLTANKKLVEKLGTSNQGGLSTSNRNFKNSVIQHHGCINHPEAVKTADNTVQKFDISANTIEDNEENVRKESSFDDKILRQPMQFSGNFISKSKGKKFHTARQKKNASHQISQTLDENSGTEFQVTPGVEGEIDNRDLLEEEVDSMYAAKQLKRRYDESHKQFPAQNVEELSRNWNVVETPYRSAVPLSSPANRYSLGQAFGPELYYPQSLADYSKKASYLESRDAGSIGQNPSNAKVKAFNLFSSHLASKRDVESKEDDYENTQ